MKRKRIKPLNGEEHHLFVNALRGYLGLEPLYGTAEEPDGVKYYGKQRAQARKAAEAEDINQPIAAE